MKAITRSHLTALMLLPLVLLFFSSETLDKAYNKDFWGDEATDIFVTIPQPPMNMLKGQIKDQQTGSPFYFMAQNLYLKKTLAREASEGKGLDWRVSFRVVPLASLLIGMLFFFLFLFRDQPLVAALSLVFLSTYGQTVWFAAETRIYATWLSASLLFLAAAVRLLNQNTWLNFSWWILSILACVGVAITSPIFIGLFILIALPQALLSKQRILALQLLAGGAISVALYKFWTLTAGKPFLLSNFKESSGYYLTHFSRYGLDMAGGPKGLSISLICAGLLYFARSEHSRMYRAIALASLALIGANFAVYLAQIGVGYFFAERHAIFALAPRAVLRAAAVVLMIEVAWKQNFAQRLLRHKRWLATVFIFLACFEWTASNLKQLRSGIHFLSDYMKPYCSGSVFVDDMISDSPSGTDDQLRVLKITNIKRHSGKCQETVSRTGTGKLYNYKFQ